MKDKENVYIGYLLYAAIIGIVTLCTWVAGSYFSDSISNYEVIAPDTRVRCVVVSRMFNTSVDCWKIDYNLQNPAD